MSITINMIGRLTTRVRVEMESREKDLLSVDVTATAFYSSDLQGIQVLED
jgi:hypothetical protein